jgi:hypothetical protein
VSRVNSNMRAEHMNSNMRAEHMNSNMRAEHMNRNMRAEHILFLVLQCKGVLNILEITIWFFRIQVSSFGLF